MYEHRLRFSKSPAPPSCGTLVETYQTDPFGVPTATQGTHTQRMQFTGEPLDAESGFLYLRARYYDPQTGRFTSRDPLSGLTTNVRSLHRYTYSQDNPATMADPSGLFCGGWTAGATAALGFPGLGAAGTTSYGQGLCGGGDEGAHLGQYATLGYFAGTPGANVGFPDQRGSMTYGAYAGFGGGGWLSNANDFSQLEGPFRTLSIDGKILGGLSLQVSLGRDRDNKLIWQASLGAGPGTGFDVTLMTTYTAFSQTAGTRSRECTARNKVGS